MRRSLASSPARQAGSEAKNSSGLLRLIALATTTRPESIDAVNLKDVLGEIEPNSRDSRQIGDRLSNGRRSLQTVAHTTTILTPLLIEPDVTVPPLAISHHHAANRRSRTIPDRRAAGRNAVRAGLRGFFARTKALMMLPSTQCDRIHVHAIARRVLASILGRIDLRRFAPIAPYATATSFIRRRGAS